MIVSFIITWYSFVKKKRILKHQILFVFVDRISVSSQNGSLMISSVIPNDQGFYECFVTRDDDTVNHHDSGTLFMEVIEELKFVPPPASKQLELHSVGKIHCRAQGSPTPQIKWQLVSNKFRCNNVVRMAFQC